MKSESLNIRKPWIDLSKVVLIYLMVACHIGVSQITDTIIVSFHMSAFFMISGYLHRHWEWLQSIKKAVKRLLVPVLFFNLLGFCIWVINNTDVSFSVKEYVTKPILGIILLNPSIARPMCMPMWFCIALFFIKILLLPCNKTKMYIITLVGCLAISVILLNYKFSGSNFIGRIFLGSVFYIIGFLLKGNIDKLLYTKSWLRSLLTALFLSVLCMIALYNGRPSWLNFEFGRFIMLFLLTSILGAFATFFISSLIYRNTFSVITYLSNNTLTILGVHLLLFPLLPPINHFIDALIVLVLCLPIIWIFNRFIPTLIGNKRIVNKTNKI